LASRSFAAGSSLSPAYFSATPFAHSLRSQLIGVSPGGTFWSGRFGLALRSGNDRSSAMSTVLPTAPAYRRNR
jgi:hypothetical protein